MQTYIDQLLEDIAAATTNVPKPYNDPEISIWDIPTPEEEEQTASAYELEEYTGIYKAQLPPAELLSDAQINVLLKALNKLLEECNWHFVLQIEVPERIQYHTMRDCWDQPMRVKQWNMDFFELCRPGTAHKTCGLGEYCQCAFFKDFFADCVDEELSPEEERRRALDIEIKNLQRKYNDGWMKYYPYHLDPEYDDEDGNPYDYGANNWLDDEDGDWWRK